MTGRVILLTASLLEPVEVRYADGTLVPGVLIAIDPDYATVDVQVDSGVVRALRRYSYYTRSWPRTWQWPNAPEPLAPDGT